MLAGMGPVRTALLLAAIPARSLLGRPDGYASSLASDAARASPTAGSWVRPSWWPSAVALGQARERRRRLVDGGVVSSECRTLLRRMKLEWVVRHFTCDAKMKKTAGVEMVIGTGLGDTGTRSAAYVVDRLGIEACHMTEITIDRLRRCSEHDMSAFASSRAWFDTPVASVWRRLACAFPNHKLVHTTRFPYHRDFRTKLDSKNRSMCRGDLPSHFAAARCIEYGTTCPSLADALVVFEDVAKSLRRDVPPQKLHVMNLSTGFRLDPLAQFLGVEVPEGMRGRDFPHSSRFFCNNVRQHAPKRDAPKRPTDRVRAAGHVAHRASQWRRRPPRSSRGWPHAVDN